jgi:hypothetical protein
LIEAAARKETQKETEDDAADQHVAPTLVGGPSGDAASGRRPCIGPSWGLVGCPLNEFGPTGQVVPAEIRLSPEA